MTEVGIAEYFGMAEALLYFSKSKCSPIRGYRNKDKERKKNSCHKIR